MLPPGPRAPKPVQTARMLLRPVPFSEACRRRYGDTFTVRILGPGELVFISDPPSIKRLFAADRINTIAPGRNIVLEPVMGSRSVLLLEGEEHLRRRKLMLPPFHGERMRAYEGVIAEATEREIARWPEARAFPLHPSMQAITLEVILRAVFGVTEGRRDALRDNLTQILSATVSPAAVALTLPALRRLGRFRRVSELLADTDRLLFEEIAERRSAPDLEAREDILSMLVAARFEDGQPMGDGEVRDQLMTLLLAGHETTATALAWAFDQLFRHPAAFERLRAEVEGDGDEYLDAVIEETLRVRPVVPFTGRKLLQDAELGGHELPAGTVAMVSIYLVHTREDVYPDPYAFRPERFLDGKPETYSWVPFGGGTRRCLGASFAEFEMRVALRTILRRTELRPGSEEPERIVRRNITLSPRRGTPAVVAARR
jgi:cytochrome P450